MDATVWEIVVGISAGLGLSAACGLRVFLPLFVASVGVHLGAFASHPDVLWLGTWPAVIGLGIATAAEVGAYYVPWLDNLLDTVASPASLVAGVLVAATLFVGMDPFLEWTAAIIVGGGAAGSVQGATVVARAATTTATGGIANPVLATLENVGAFILALLSLLLPVLAGVAVLIVLGLAWRRLRRWRMARREASAA